MRENGHGVNWFGNRILQWPPNQRLPEGWQVIQLDSGHYMVECPAKNIEGCIWANRFSARRHALALATRDAAVSPSPIPTEPTNAL